MDRTNVFPALRYADGAAAIEWLSKAFGFEKHVVVPGPGGSVAHAQLRFGAGMILLGSSTDSTGTNPWATTPQGVYVRAKAAGADIVRKLADTPYGSREYSVRDLEGHLWSFGTYDPWKHG